ncbi:MAG: exopolysaccharide biosynthesis polyprenyl glycosylphosphotransferase [Clostridiaceae bacterium]|jgi:exopolysaccharide biosynthesis polyprenyl glycosylphosphotransferase|nr:exopolysaccharide biosynthesis polyprenyl glycosylphosphotransferase [Clostridiaceae bacterium]
MNSSNKFVFFKVYHFIADILCLAVSYYVSYIVTSGYTQLNNIKGYSWIVIIYIPIWVFIMSVSGMYDTTTFTYYDRIFKNVLKSTIFSSLLVAALKSSIKDTMYNGLLFLIFFMISLLAMLIERYVILYVIKFPNSKSRKKVIFVGVSSMYEKFNNYINKTDIKIEVLSCIALREDKHLNENEFLVDVKNFQETLKQNVIDEIYFAIPIIYLNEIQKYIAACEEMGITSRVLLELSDVTSYGVHVASLGTFPMLTVHSISLNSLQLFIKRIIDIVGALVGIILSSLIWVIAAAAIKLDSPGPVFYSQSRVGMNGRVFKLYKFRSMFINADEKKKELEAQNEMSDGLMFKMKNDPRVTKVGRFIRKTSIDELPQFLNVLKGDMSLVGTRPPTVDEVSHYENYHRRRISIKPGITGMWQVSGRSTITNFSEVVSLDTKYIDHWSVWLDFKLMIKTVMVVLARKGAS